jgi:hypothetical protein
MPISEQKTHVSGDTFEFAKRWFHKGLEVTGFSIAGFGSVWKRYSLLHNYLSTQRDHGWNLEMGRHPELVSAIYKLYGKPAHAQRVVKLYMVFDALAQAKNTGAHLLLAQRIEEYFGIPVSQHLGRLSVQAPTLEALTTPHTCGGCETARRTRLWQIPKGCISHQRATERYAL